MKRYKLLKDLPFAKAGTVFTRNTFKSKDGLSDYDYLETNILLDGDKDETTFGIKRNYFINNFDEWFERSGEYYYIDSKGDIEYAEYDWNKLVLKPLKLIGNYFETYDEAKKYLEYLKAKAIIKQDTKGFKPNWKNPSQKRFFGYYNLIDKKLCYFNAGENMESKIYFKSEEDIEESFKKHPEEWKTYIDYER